MRPQMKRVRFDPLPAVLLAVPDTELRPHLQTYPFLNGPNREVNESILAPEILAVATGES
jgi:hypothetical protein